MERSVGRWHLRWILVLVGGIALSVRLGLLAWIGILYQPGSGDDTLYRAMAVNLLQSGSFQAQGERPPLYPLLLAAIWRVTGPDRIFPVIVLQWALGIGSTLLWTHMAWLLSGSARLTLLTGLVSTFIIPSLLLEFRLLTEPLSTTLIALSLWTLIRWMRTPQQTRWLLLCGVSLALLGLTRVAVFLVAVVPWLVLTLQYRWWRNAGRWTRTSLALLGPMLLALSGWLAWQQQTIGRATLSTYDGYSLTNTVCAGMDAAPEQYAALRTIYLEERAAQYAQYGTCAMTIWRAYPAMQQATGQSFADLSVDVRRMALAVMAQRPAVYIRSVLIGSLLTLFEAPVLANTLVLKVGYQPLHYLAVLAALVGLGISLTRLARMPAGAVRQQLGTMLLLCVGMLGYIVAVSALFEFGENGRYRLPFDMALHWQWLCALWLWRHHSHSEQRGVDSADLQIHTFESDARASGDAPGLH